MRIEVRYKAPGRYETAIAERDDPGATFRLRTHGSVAEVDVAIRVAIDRTRAWGSLKLPILVEGPSGPSGPQDEIPQILLDALSMITAEAESRGSAPR